MSKLTGLEIGFPLSERLDQLGFVNSAHMRERPFGIYIVVDRIGNSSL